MLRSVKYYDPDFEEYVDIAPSEALVDLGRYEAELGLSAYTLAKRGNLHVKTLTGRTFTLRLLSR